MLNETDRIHLEEIGLLDDHEIGLSVGVGLSLGINIALILFLKRKWKELNEHYLDRKFAKLNILVRIVKVKKMQKLYKKILDQSVDHTCCSGHV